MTVAAESGGVTFGTPCTRIALFSVHQFEFFLCSQNNLKEPPVLEEGEEIQEEDITDPLHQLIMTFSRAAGLMQE